MRKGKMIAQGAHASRMFLVQAINQNILHNEYLNNIDPTELETSDPRPKGIKYYFPKIQRDWIKEKFTTICCQVNDEEELDDIFNRAREAGLTVHMITDSGKTEFNGVNTKTCLAIGPDEPEKIDKITGHLKLL